MQNMYSIGEIASIFSETTETFRHYDRVGLLKPSLIKSNGYRYYSLDQFELISTIFQLRSIGTSIKRIKEILHSSSRAPIIDELNTQKHKLLEQIDHLNYLESQTSDLLMNLHQFDSKKIQLSKEPDFYILDHAFSSEGLSIDSQQAASLHYNIDSEWLKYSNIISIINPKHLLAGSYHHYSRYGLLSDKPCITNNPMYHELHSRLYVTVCTRIDTYDHSEIDHIYITLMNFIKSKCLIIDGNAFERNILDLYNEDCIGDTHYIKIYIPVKK